MLTGKTALVTGASRGLGRGIACVLGEAGATVYLTGRSRAGSTTEGLPGTIEEAAREVSERGGLGVPVACDYTVDEQVEALFARVTRERGGLDLLVNNIWGGYEGHDLQAFTAPFWEQPGPTRWQGMFEAGVRAHMRAAQLAVPLMLERRSGLILSTIAWDRDRYLGNLFYDVAKHALVRLAFGMARELRPHNIAALALAAGFTRTERVLAAHAARPFDLDPTESPEYTGRAVAALAADPQVMLKSGRAWRTGDLAREYGFTDIDGRQVPPFELPE